MDLLEVLGLSRPIAEAALCLELYLDTIPGDCQQQQQQQHLDALRLRCMQLLQPHVEGFIWQQEPLRLQSSLQQQPPWALRGRRHPHEQQPQQQASQQQPAFLWGVVRYEDSVEDEWFVVWLLLQLTRQLPGLTARCWDDDGEFLLIEAAYSLPRWLKPETASNRVWLRGGQLHIIPPPSDKAPTLPPAPSVSEALAVLASGAVQTRRKKVEACVMERVSGYPGQAQQQVQRTTAWLPRRLGLLLQADPQLVAGAVAAFMTRQRDEVQAASRLRLFPPTDMTTALVSLNRCMYAQLLQADFAPPKTYPTSPSAAAASTAGSSSSSSSSSGWLGGDSARQHKAVAMGLKLAVGMELMALRLGLLQPTAAAADGAAANADAEAASGPAAAAAGDAHQHEQQQDDGAAAASLASNPAWHSYKAVLQRSGYFDGELEGSARYRQLLAAAQCAFTGSEAYERSTAALAAPKQRLEQLLASLGAAAGGAGGAEQQQQLPPLAAVLDVDRCVADPAAATEDGDEWMQEEAEQLQQRLQQAELMASAHTTTSSSKRQQQHGAAAAAAAGADGDGAAVVDAEQLVSGLRGFVQHLGSVEGAEVPTAHPPAPAPAAAAAAAAAGSSSGKRHAPSSKPPKARQQQQGNGRSGRAAAAAGPGGLDFDPDAFMSELLGVFGAAPSGLQDLPQQQQQHKQQDAAAAAAMLQQARALQQQLEQLEAMAGQQGFAAAAAAGGVQEDSDDYGSSGSSSSDEGASFYGSDDSEAEDNVDSPVAAGGLQQQRSAHAAAAGSSKPPPPPQQRQHREPVMLQVPPPASNTAAARQGQRQQQQQQPGVQQQQRLWGQQDAWEVMTATDSDDDALSIGGSGSGSDGEEDSEAAGDAAGRDGSSNTDGFYDSYSAAMDAELAATAMAQTFERVQLDDASGAAQTAGGGSSSSRGGAGATAAAAGADAGLTPLDVDFNLIKSLVASHTAQGGLPGPASNLAGLLGLQLPTEPGGDGAAASEMQAGDDDE